MRKTRKHQKRKRNKSIPTILHASFVMELLTRRAFLSTKSSVWWRKPMLLMKVAHQRKQKEAERNQKFRKREEVTSIQPEDQAKLTQGLITSMSTKINKSLSLPRMWSIISNNHLSKRLELAV